MGLGRSPRETWRDGMSDTVRVERRDDGVTVLTLARPDRLNALSSAVAADLAAAVTEVAADDALRAIVVAGEGKAFCAGADIAELSTLDGSSGFAAFVHRLTDALDVLASCPKPSVAALHGAVLGGGLELALACDLRIADETAKLGVPEIRLGLLPGAAGTVRLPRLLPEAVAKHLLLTGEPMTAADAERFGLVNHVVPAGEALDAACALAARLAALAPLALAAAKRLVDEPLHEAITVEPEVGSNLAGTDDGIEGRRAFLEKPP